MNSFTASFKGFVNFQNNLSIENVLVVASEITTINWFLIETCISWPVFSSLTIVSKKIASYVGNNKKNHSLNLF